MKPGYASRVRGLLLHLGVGQEVTIDDVAEALPDIPRPSITCALRDAQRRGVLAAKGTRTNGRGKPRWVYRIVTLLALDPERDPPPPEAAGAAATLPDVTGAMALHAEVAEAARLGHLELAARKARLLTMALERAARKGVP